ncbi:MAG TPA: FAD-dependent oxidoreductase [Candidatus Angelobacter sp.]|nr:FAD-dependent oxidoreductase [Candidatus Angelobacter sp.]
MTTSKITYKLRLTEKEYLAEGTMGFHFEKPAGFQFKAGQYVDVTLIHPTDVDSSGSIRSFSIASSPEDPDLLFATRMRDSAFKRVLKASPYGTEVEMEGPMGSFTLHNKIDKPAVFLAGGIGITPFLSMVRHATQARLPHDLSLFYSNRRPEDAAFMRNLETLENENSRFCFVPSMTEMEKSQHAWTGETGFIDQQMLGRYLPDLKGPIYYTAGPPAMVAAMRHMLNAAGVDDDDVRAEEFAGY